MQRSRSEESLGAPRAQRARGQPGTTSQVSALIRQWSRARGRHEKALAGAAGTVPATGPAGGHPPPPHRAQLSWTQEPEETQTTSFWKRVEALSHSNRASGRTDPLLSSRVHRPRTQDRGQEAVGIYDLRDHFYFHLLPQDKYTVKNGLYSGLWNHMGGGGEGCSLQANIQV